MGDMSRFPEGRQVSIDPYALVSAIMGSQVRSGEASTATEREYDDLVDVRRGEEHNDEETQMNEGRGPRPDQAPKNVCIGAANPYAIVEAMLGRRIDKYNTQVTELMANVLQTDYDELFDMKHHSLLYAGLRLNEKERKAERFTQKDMKILDERDLVTPDLSRVQRIKDLERIGISDVDNIKVKVARLQNGKLRLVLHAHQLGRTVTNREVTRSLNELITPFRRHHGDSRGGRWTPPNGSWRDMYDYFFQMFNRRLVEDVNQFRIGKEYNMNALGQVTVNNKPFTAYNRFDDPQQGCSTNSWLIAALFSVYWSDPCSINRDTRLYGSDRHRRSGGGCGRRSSGSDEDSGEDERDRSEGQRRVLSIKFHDKGGDNNNKTQIVDVNYEIPMNNSNNEPLYCRASDGADIWPSLYEKAFAKWITGTDSDQPDITQTHCGDPIKAMAQINGREPLYYHCERHNAADLVGLVRHNCVNFKTINPMTAFTHATGDQFRGANIVANHAYSVLGYAILGGRQYMVLRNPWGVSEPQGLSSYPGLVSRVETDFWTPAALLDHGGLFALEAEAFKHCFDYIGVAK
ncbi:hypothetical protein M0657_010065 [Pyricularia oryzae]|uniref:Calpain catalytic domain-containing protein n=2 Tax=Pyricularia oryzae TaxID=318829 RepID=A0AA97PQV1_PYRO3|nr:hypothetical protein OOU_Y34scaffold00159g8 [Pyricularia oryzae Y34]KAI7913344.1 hypothetical protein M0657_010065 [Pyricularia oryzae]